MILRILLLACAILSPSYGKMDYKTFVEKFKTACILTEETIKINGQDKPLSQTIENFIALAEKFEVANPNGVDLKAELAYFLSEYLFENIEFVGSGGVSEWKLPTATMKAIDDLWNPDGNKPYQPNDPYSQDEKCSLYYMISHSILENSIQRSMGYAPGNFSSRSNPMYFENYDSYYPQEIGVVAIRGTDAAVSLSKVLIGMYVGLLNNRISPIENVPDQDLPSDTVDLLYATTLADVLVVSNWTTSRRRNLLPNGDWMATHISTDKSINAFCPMVYSFNQQPKLQDVVNGELPIHSYSSLRGAADGLILGLAVPQLYSKKTNTKLSQILRMYYSREGISLDPPVEDKLKHVTFCNRLQLVDLVDGELHDHMLSYAYLIAQEYSNVAKIVNDAERHYSNIKESVFNDIHSEIREYCGKSFNMERPEDLPRETYLDVIVVMDSSSQERYFHDQQMIIGLLAKKLDLRYTGSRMTILLDQRDNSERTTLTSTITLKPVVFDSYSSSCAACMAGQIQLDDPFQPLEREDVIVAIDQFLRERKNNETKYSGVNGKVVVYFNYDNDEKNGNNKVQGRLVTALRNLHLNHQDVAFYAVGLYPSVLEKYVKNDPKLIFVGNNGTQETVAKGLFEKITFAPALLQYTDCEEAKNEKGETYENFVSPHKIQHYIMPAEYFYKSKSISINFESQNGYINVCHNRVTPRPEYQARSCKNTTGTAPIEFKISNPCINSNKIACSPFYFSIMGMDTSPDTMRSDPRPRNYCEDTNDHWCSNLNQIKYKVSHTGIRCSGCLRLNAPIVVIFFTVLLTYFVHKRF